jgi:hypothetical protein
MAYNLFISHSWKYGDAYDKLVNMLDEEKNFSYKNFSVPKDDPVHTSGTDKELYEAIKNKIKLCNVVLIMTGKYSSYSKWIKKEIKICEEEFQVKKPILAIHPWGATQASTVVVDAADAEARWNSASIIKGIKALG